MYSRVLHTRFIWSLESIVGAVYRQVLSTVGLYLYTFILAPATIVCNTRLLQILMVCAKLKQTVFPSHYYESHSNSISFLALSPTMSKFMPLRSFMVPLAAIRDIDYAQIGLNFLRAVLSIRKWEMLFVHAPWAPSQRNSHQSSFIDFLSQSPGINNYSLSIVSEGTGNVEEPNFERMKLK